MQTKVANVTIFDIGNCGVLTLLLLSRAGCLATPKYRNLAGCTLRSICYVDNGRKISRGVDAVGSSGSLSRTVGNLSTLKQGWTARYAAFGNHGFV